MVRIYQKDIKKSRKKWVNGKMGKKVKG